MEWRSSQDTCRAFLWNSLLRTPFWALFGMLPFILYKDLQATPLEITALVTIKPLAALFSMHWSSRIHKRRDQLRSNIRWGTFFSYLPFFFVPWISSPWYFVAASGIFMLFNRGVIPAWMELLKINVPDPKRHQIFSIGSTFCYLGGGGFPILIGWLLDGYTDCWKWLLPSTAILASLGVLMRKGLNATTTALPPEESASTWSLQQIIVPWKQAHALLKQHPDFACFQLGFLLGGAGIMVIQPELPALLMDVIGTTYTELGIALTLCKGIGFAVTSPLWARWLQRIEIHRFSSYVTTLAALFPVGLALAYMHLSWLFVAYLIYGVMQAGSELSWHLSGTIFARQQDSSPFTGISILMVGLRGCVAPPLGSLLFAAAGPGAVLILGGLLCLGGTIAFRMNFMNKTVTPAA